MTRNLIVFTRYPEAGKTKTRLIPALGEEGAADLSRDLIGHTMGVAAAVCEDDNVQLSVWFTGCDEDGARRLAPGPYTYHEQTGEDLGSRMEVAFAAAFDGGYDRAVIVGSDCPELSDSIVRTAFQELADADVVLGPAEDGGYYLIGMRAPSPVLVEGVEWGTSSVFDATVGNAREHGLSVATLPVLRDVDRPEDLSLYEAWKALEVARSLQSPPEPAPAPAATAGEESPRGAPEGTPEEPVPAEPRISVVIPALNEATRIAAAVKSAFSGGAAEVIAVDGGSWDDTVAEAEASGAHVLVTEPHRARQMNAGAAAATGDVLLFLHADTVLPEGYASAVTDALSDSRAVAGAFSLGLDAESPKYRLVEAVVRLRCRLFDLPYGDQGIFLSTGTFRDIGGFADLPLMEDVEIIDRLRRQGRVKVIPQSVTTSSRRWERLGVVLTTLVNYAVFAAYRLGVSPSRLARWYRGRSS